MKKRLLDIREIADWAHVSTGSIRRYIRDPVNPMPAVRLGRVLRFDPVAVENWFRTRWVADETRASAPRPAKAVDTPARPHAAHSDVHAP